MHTFRAFLSGCVLSLTFAGFDVKPAHAVNSDSPEVKAMIEKSLGYLATASHDQVGGKCLIAPVVLSRLAVLFALPVPAQVIRIRS